MSVEVLNTDKNGGEDGGGVKMWVPSALRGTVKLGDDGKVEAICTEAIDSCVEHPVFIPSNGRAPHGAYLHWGSVDQADDACTTAVRILVVRHDQYDVYKRHWGKEYLVLQLPRQMMQSALATSITVTAEQGKIGFSRYVLMNAPYILHYRRAADGLDRVCTSIQCFHTSIISCADFRHRAIHCSVRVFCSNE
jgi:hypothetical protein